MVSLLRTVRAVRDMSQLDMVAWGTTKEVLRRLSMGMRDEKTAVSLAYACVD